MVLAGLGLNPAGALPFRNHALQSSFRTKGPLPRSCFPNLWHVLLGFLCLWLHCWGFCACGCIIFLFFRPSESNVRQFYGGWFWQVWAWILLGFCRFGTTLYRAPFGHPAGVLLFRFGLESCWGSAMFCGFTTRASFQTCGMSCWSFLLLDASSTPGRSTIFLSGVRTQRQAIFRGGFFRLGRAALRWLPLRPSTSFSITFPCVCFVFSQKPSPNGPLCHMWGKHGRKHVQQHRFERETACRSARRHELFRCEWCCWLMHGNMGTRTRSARSPTMSFSFPPPFRGRRHGRQPFNYYHYYLLLIYLGISTAQKCPKFLSRDTFWAFHLRYKVPWNGCRDLCESFEHHLSRYSRNGLL